MALLDDLMLDEATEARAWIAAVTEEQSVALCTQNESRAAMSRFYVATRSGLHIYRCWSSDFSGKYEIRYDPAADRVLSCTCMAGQHGKSCWHKGSVRKNVERMKARAAHYERYGSGYDD